MTIDYVEEAFRQDGIIPITADAVTALSFEVRRLTKALEYIRDHAFSPRDDDEIWIDDRTNLGGYIDMRLTEQPRTEDPQP